MNSVERVMTALARKEPDRVPLMEFVIDPKVAQAICPEASDVPDFCDRMDMDGVGCGASFRRTYVDEHTYVDEWGVTYKDSPEVVNHPLRGCISSLNDLVSYRPPDPEAPHRLGDLPDLVRRYKGKRAIAFHHRAAFMWSAYLLGIENLLLSFVAEPRLAEAVMDMVVEVNEAIIRRAVRAGADIVVLGDDYASNKGPMMSPAAFKRFLLPRLRRIVDAIHDEGGMCVKHSDGNLWLLLDHIIDSGTDCINPIEPVAGMDIGEVKRKYGSRVCLAGNIDCGRLLSEGTPDEVWEAVRDCIRKASYGGGHILTSSNSIHSSVRPQNYYAMIQAGQALGGYPLQV